jgi:hypothetical protein
MISRRPKEPSRPSHLFHYQGYGSSASEDEDTRSLVYKLFTQVLEDEMATRTQVLFVCMYDI